MYESKITQTENPPKKFKSFDILLIIITLICVLMISLNVFLYYKNSKVSNAYAKRAYELYRDNFMPFFNDITMRELDKRKDEYNALDNREQLGFNYFLLTYYKLDSAIGNYSKINASGLDYFSGRVHPTLFKSRNSNSFDSINTGANIPSEIEATFDQFVTLKDEDRFYYYFHFYSYTDYKRVEEIFNASINIHKEIMRVMNEELTKGNSYYKAICEAGIYINDPIYYSKARKN